MKDSSLNLALQRMNQGYEAQIPFYEGMYAIALEQEATLLLEEVDADQLVDLITGRQDLIGSLEELNGEITRLKGEVCATLGIKEFSISTLKERLTGPNIEALAEVLGRLAQLLQKIKELDKTNEDTLRVRIRDTKDKLAQLQNAKKANKAYKPESQVQDGVFVDFSK